MATKKKKAEPAKAMSAKDVFAVMGKMDKEKDLKSITLEKKKAEDFMSTGLCSVDLIMGGGQYGGQVMQCYGAEHSGKCLVKSSICATPEGARTLEEIFDLSGTPAVSTTKMVEFSTPLINRYGEVEECSRLFMNGPRNVFRIATESGGYVDSTANHPHLVMSERGQWVWRATEDLRPGDYLLRKPVECFGKVEEDPSTAYLLGVYVADAHFGKQRIAVTNDDPDVLAVIRSHGQEVVGKSPKVYDKNGMGSLAYHFSSKEEVTRFYDKYGVDAGTSASKRVPKAVRSFNRTGVVNFLRGYFDCESYCDSISLEVSSASHELLHDVKLLLENFGIRASIKTKTASNYPENSYWRLALMGRELRSFIELIGTESTKVQGRYQAVLDAAAGKKENTHNLSVPNLGALLRDLYDSCAETTRFHSKLFGDVMEGRYGKPPKARLTYDRLNEILMATSEGHWDKNLRGRLEEISEAGYYYDQVKDVEGIGKQPVFDIEMPKSHSFIANGFVTHNSTFGYTSAGFLTREMGIPCAFLDHEGTTDRAMTEQPGIGVDYNLVKYFRPKTGEMAYEWINDFCESLPDKHFGVPQAVIFIDTVKAMKPQKYIDSPDSKQPALEAVMHSKGIAKIQTLITNKNVSIVGLNQVRGNVGNPYQSPESVPGGAAWKFFTTNLLRLGRGKVVELPNGAYFQEVRFKTYKNKNFIPLQECKVHLELGVGFDVASDVVQFLKLAGYYYKRGKGGKIVKSGGLPTIRGLDELLREGGYEGAIEADGDYKSTAQLEGIIREWGRTGPIWDACRMALTTGKAIERFRASKKTESDDHDESLIGTKRVQKTSVTGGNGIVSDEDDIDDDDLEEAVVPPSAYPSVPELEGMSSPDLKDLISRLSKDPKVKTSGAKMDPLFVEAGALLLYRQNNEPEDKNEEEVPAKLGSQRKKKTVRKKKAVTKKKAAAK